MRRSASHLRLVRRLAVAISLAFCVLDGLDPGLAQAGCSDPFARPEEVVDFHVRMARADWNQLLAFTLTPDDCDGSHPEFRAEFRCGPDEPWIRVAVQKKRGTERGVEAPQKPPLKIQFNEDFSGAVPGAKNQRWPAILGAGGYRVLSLNNGQANKPPGTTFLLPVLLKEHVALRLLNREVPFSPRTAYAKLFLHFDDGQAPQYHGVYILIEDIDRDAIARRVGPVAARGTLLKKTKPACPPEVRFDDGAPNAAGAAFESWLGQDPGAHPGTWRQRSEDGVDLEALLRQEAIREILVNGTDTIVNNTGGSRLGNNYYAFDPRAGARRQYIPWDLDQAFGHLQGLCMPNPFKCRPDQPLLAQCREPLPRTLSALGRLTVCQPEIRGRYLEIMCQLINGSLSADAILTTWDQADRAVRPIIPLEKDRIWGGRDPLDPATDLSYGAEYERLRAWIPERIASVRQQLQAAGVACGEGCPAGASERCRFFGCEGVRRCVGGAWSACELPSPCRPALPEEVPATPGDAGAGGTPPTDPRAPLGSDGGAGTVRGAAWQCALVGRGVVPPATSEGRPRRSPVAGGAGAATLLFLLVTALRRAGRARSRRASPAISMTDSTRGD